MGFPAWLSPAQTDRIVAFQVQPSRRMPDTDLPAEFVARSLINSRGVAGQTLTQIISLYSKMQ